MGGSPKHNWHVHTLSIFINSERKFRRLLEPTTSAINTAYRFFVIVRFCTNILICTNSYKYIDLYVFVQALISGSSPINHRASRQVRRHGFAWVAPPETIMAFTSNNFRTGVFYSLAGHRSCQNPGSAIPFHMR